MLRYTSSRHRRLMDESEFALHDVPESAPARTLRVVDTLLQDRKIYAMWEARHADLLRPVAEHRDATHQILSLRKAEVRLIHHQALFRYLREHQVRGERRRRLFRVFHNTLDFHAAVLAEHRQFMLAVSSSACTNHLMDVMHDASSPRLLCKYEALYNDLFSMQCDPVAAGDRLVAELIRPTLVQTREQLRHVRQRIDEERPVDRSGGLDRELVLARISRYPMSNYMVG